MSRPLFIVRLLRSGFPYRTRIAKLSKLPLVGEIFYRTLFKGDDITFLPIDEVVSIKDKEKPDGSFAMPCEVIESLTEKASFIWKMDECICRKSMNCSDYPVNLGCLFLGDAAKGINSALGREISSGEAKEHLEKCRDAGLIHLIGRNRIDTVWLGVSPPEKLLTICNCCECCCLWKVLPFITDKVAMRVHKLPGVSIRVTDACKGCRKCVETCFVEAIIMKDDVAHIGKECRGCARCISRCPNNAIVTELEKDYSLEAFHEKVLELTDIE